MEELLSSILSELRSMNEKLKVTTGALDIKAAANFLGVSENFLRLKCRSNEVPHRRLGDKYLFTADALNQWLMNNDNQLGQLRKVKG